MLIVRLRKHRLEKIVELVARTFDSVVITGVELLVAFGLGIEDSLANGGGCVHLAEVLTCKDCFLCRVFLAIDKTTRDVNSACVILVVDDIDAPFVD